MPSGHNGRMSDQTPPPPPPPQLPPTPPTPPTPPYGAGPAYTAPPQPLSPADEKLWATLIHVGGILFGWLAPLIGYLILKDRGPFVRAHSATALNFHLTVLIGYAIGFVLSFVFIGFFVIIAIGVLVLVFGIMAALAANRGEYYTYPMSIKFVS